MAAIIEVENLRDGYTEICNAVINRGRAVSPRGMESLELEDVTMVIHDPHDPLPVGIGRALNPAIAVIEALQLIGGVAYPSLTCKIAPNMVQFMNGGSFTGAYGPRIAPQMSRAIDRLVADPDSRQAVVQMWRPLDLFEMTNDLPCTVFLQFTIRDDKLTMHTHMRSNDVWWGLAYDGFQFTQLQATVANVLGLGMGAYVHHVVSLHAYVRDFDKIASLEQSGKERPFKWEGISCPEGTYFSSAMRAVAIIEGGPLAAQTASEGRMREILTPYHGATSA